MGLDFPWVQAHFSLIPSGETDNRMSGYQDRRRRGLRELCSLLEHWGKKASTLSLLLVWGSVVRKL
jgi:hypothetical protein